MNKSAKGKMSAESAEDVPPKNTNETGKTRDKVARPSFAFTIIGSDRTRTREMARHKRRRNRLLLLHPFFFAFYCVAVRCKGHSGKHKGETEYGAHSSSQAQFKNRIGLGGRAVIAPRRQLFFSKSFFFSVFKARRHTQVWAGNNIKILFI